MASGPPTSVRTARRSWRDLQRITSIRIIVQTTTFGLFLAFVLLTTFANLDRLPGLRFWLGKFLEVDPLIAISNALATHTVYRGLLWALVVLVPTLFLGRFFCGWVCPYGSLHHFVGWLLGYEAPLCDAQPVRSQPAVSERSESRQPNRYRPYQRVKYCVLIGVLVAAALGSLQIGLLDPLCLVYRSMTAAILPAAQMPLPAAFGPPRVHQGAWLIGFLVFGLVAANLVYPRFFCRVLCPLGALLGILGRLAWWRIERDPARCRGCERCRLHCPGACDPHLQLRKAECFVCFNCLEECPENALRFALFPPRQHEIASPDLGRRQVLLASVTGLLFYPFARLSGRVTADFSSAAIRPPGAVEELEFLARCVKCDQCAHVCPTNTIQPAWFECGLEGLWSPVLNFRVGHCQLHCTACGYVCPTGAIQPITVAQKLGLGEFAAQGPVRLGTAHIDVGRCLPHSAGIPCQVCVEVCPTSPKAIRTERPRHQGWRGGRGGERDATLAAPTVDIDLCIGCGLCERQCPIVGDRRAIYVTAEGESRSQHCTRPERNRAVRFRVQPGARD